MNLEQWLDYQQRVHPRAIAMGLERIATVATRLGLSRPARVTITVAGTNGKGSTVAFIDAIARNSGYRVGAYTSPHLLRYTERVRIDGREVGESALIAAFERIETARGDIPLTYFEFGTLAALLVFADAALDLALLEVGLGGRLDAVNLIDADAAVLTTVALDHMEYLGPDRERIGAEKAGIFRSNRPAVIAEPDPPESVLKYAERIGAKVLRAGKHYGFSELPDNRWSWQDGALELVLPKPRLMAPAQITNAAAAIVVLRALQASLPVTSEQFAAGVASATLPARLQRFADPIEILVDVAHNPQAAQQLAQWLTRHRPQGTTQAVFAALADKDAPNMVAPLLACVDQWRIAGLPEAPLRGQDVDSLWRKLSKLLSCTLSSRHVTVADALAVAREQARVGDRILVFGSFHTAAEALRALSLDPGSEAAH